MSYKAERAWIHFTPRFTLTLNLLSFRPDPVEIRARIPRIVASYLGLFLTRVPGSGVLERPTSLFEYFSELKVKSCCLVT